MKTPYAAQDEWGDGGTDDPLDGVSIDDLDPEDLEQVKEAVQRMCRKFKLDPEYVMNKITGG